ncbi:MAG: WXG100 family type VII secretion target [Candidatus Ancillula sp.]|nr:WXG100 family type VII secretion target [Candidatus Ancillula sp.]
MSISTFTVQPEQVHQLSQDIATGANKVQAELETLDGKVKTLMSQWSGAAQEAYHTSQAKWLQTLGELRELLTKISTATDQIGSLYSSTDNKSAQLFG